MGREPRPVPRPATRARNGAFGASAPGGAGASSAVADPTRGRPVLLPSRHHAPGPRTPRRPGERFEFIATVEAGGIEPPSEGDPPRATTCVAHVLLSRLRLPWAGSSAPAGQTFGRRVTGVGGDLARSVSP